MKKFTTLMLVLALTLTMVLGMIPLGVFAETDPTQITDTTGYSGGIRKKSDGSIMFSPFISELKALVDGGANLNDYTMEMTFTLLSGANGTEEHTFDTVSAALNKSNGQYFDVYLNGTKGNSGFCPTAGEYYNVYVEIFTGYGTDAQTKVMYGTYPGLQAASAISSSSYYAPTENPGSGDTDEEPEPEITYPLTITETTDGYTGNITYKGEGIRARSSGAISFCPYITELRTLVTNGASPSDFTAELTFSLLSEEDGEVVYTFDTVTVIPENGTGYFYLTLIDDKRDCGFCPTAGEYYHIKVDIYTGYGTAEQLKVVQGTYKSIPASSSVAGSGYYDPTAAAPTGDATVGMIVIAAISVCGLAVVSKKRYTI